MKKENNMEKENKKEVYFDQKKGMWCELQAVRSVESFIEQHRKINWEAEFENGEYCIGENAVRAILNSLSRELIRLQEPIIERTE
jgi:hypothetical protein